MLYNTNIELKYFSTFLSGNQWLLFYEFNINDSTVFQRCDQEIISSLLKTKVMGEDIYHSEMDSSEIKLSREGLKNLSRPYDFDLISIKDFYFLKSLNEFKEWIQKFRINNLEDEDTQILISRAENEIFKRTKVENGIWYLSKEMINESPEKLAELHWIYLYFETFIEIDKENQIIRTFDFGYD